MYGQGKMRVMTEKDDSMGRVRMRSARECGQGKMSVGRARWVRAGQDESVDMARWECGQSKMIVRA